MKAKLLTISAAVMALLAVSCQREETGFGLTAGEEVTVTLSASVPTGGPAVKSAENPGNGSEVNRCILGVYMVTDESSTELYGTLEYEGVGTDGTATFEDVTLLTGYDYKLVFWADNVSTTDNTDLTKDNHYVTTGFPTVIYNTADGHQYMSSDDTRDAFYGVFDLNDFSGEVQDSYILTRLATQLMQGGDVNIWRPYDFTLDGNPYEDMKLEIRTATNITLKPSAVVTVGRQQVQNYSELAINGESSGSGDKMVTGTITGEEWLVYNKAGGTLTIDGGAYKSEKASDANGGVTIYNEGTCIIDDGTFEALGYAVMNVSPGSNTSLTVNGGTFLTEGKITSYAIHTHGPRAVLNINGGSIDGVSMVNGATVTITGDNTVIYNDDGYYGVYIGRDVPSYNYPNVTIEGGYFSGYENMPDVYNGAGADGGNLTITGGFFRDNQAMLPEGYEYQSNVQTINGITYNYEVVKTN